MGKVMFSNTCTLCTFAFKSLVGGLCSTCYMREYRKKSKKTITCSKCLKTKFTRVTAGVCLACYTASQRKIHPDQQRNFYAKNKARLCANSAKYAANHLSARAASEAKRRCQKLCATAGFSNLGKIREIYDNCPDGYEVDHIIPLQSKDVCGLHVEWNLQYLTESENASKSNKFDGTSLNTKWRSV